MYFLNLRSDFTGGSSSNSYIFCWVDYVQLKKERIYALNVYIVKNYEIRKVFLDILSVQKFTANLYCIYLSIDLRYTKADEVQICGKYQDNQKCFIQAPCGEGDDQ